MSLPTATDIACRRRTGPTWTLDSGLHPNLSAGARASGPLTLACGHSITYDQQDTTHLIAKTVFPTITDRTALEVCGSDFGT
jgi:hypothetical protein